MPSLPPTTPSKRICNPLAKGFKRQAELALSRPATKVVKKTRADASSVGGGKANIKKMFPVGKSGLTMIAKSAKNGSKRGDEKQLEKAALEVIGEFTILSR